MFVPLYGNRSFNIQHVRTAQESYGEKIVWLTLDDGSKEKVSLDDWRHSLHHHLIHMMPAQPGTFSLWSATSHNENFFTIKTPVIAWGYCVDGSLYPVTYDGVNDNQDGAQVPVLLPSGQVVVFEHQWASFEEWEESERERWEEERTAARPPDQNGA